MKLSKASATIYPVILALFMALAFVNPTMAASPISRASSTPVLHTASVSPHVSLLDAGFNPNAPVGGVPFCFSGSLGSILCYPASFLKSAYNFPTGLDGTGSTIVIVDAFGSPTAQSDLNTYDTAFGIPATTVTILCGPTWTGAITDTCPLNTIGDIVTVGNTPAGQACGGVGGVTGWADETTLDLSQSHSLATGAHIVLVVANDCFDTSIYAAEQAVVGQAQYKGSIMSQSFGEPDDLVTCLAVDQNGNCTARDPSVLNLPNSVFHMAQVNHWTVIASSGDDGANEDARVLGTGELTPSFPATSPLVLAAGGTQGNPYGGDYGPPPGAGGTNSCAASTNCNTGLVVINGGANGCGTATRPGVPSSCVPVGYGGEGTWNEFDFFGLGTSSGGGFSSLYTQPAYQAASLNKGTTLLGAPFKVVGRSTPDVSFNSAIDGGVLAYLGFLGRWAVFGGTSAASPAWASIVALLNQARGSSVGFINSAVYKLGQTQVSTAHGGAFHDITSGNNDDIGAFLGAEFGVDGYNATPGYDMTTGFGTPNVSVFINNIQTFL